MEQKEYSGNPGVNLMEEFERIKKNLEPLKAARDDLLSKVKRGEEMKEEAAKLEKERLDLQQALSEDLIVGGRVSGTPTHPNPRRVQRYRELKRRLEDLRNERLIEVTEVYPEKLEAAEEKLARATRRRLEEVEQKCREEMSRLFLALTQIPKDFRRHAASIVEELQANVQANYFSDFENLEGVKKLLPHWL